MRMGENKKGKLKKKEYDEIKKKNLKNADRRLRGNL